MTTARMHSQRRVTRGENKPRFSRQRQIKRGGGDTTTGGSVQPPATGATAGNPGSFTPAGAKVPSNLAGMTGIVASPVTAWTTSQHVNLSPAGSVYWNGTAWALGVAP